MLKKALYPKIEPTVNQIASSLNGMGFTPNQLTLAGLALTLLSGFIYATGNFFLAGLFLCIASSADMIDGALARLSDKVSKFGAFLDSTVDRYSDFFLFGSLATFYAKEAQGGYFLLTLGILMGAYVTSYSKARAENFIKDCSVGIFGRSERIVAILIASVISPLMPLVLWILFIGTNVTAIQRILYTRKMLSQSEGPQNIN